MSTQTIATRFGLFRLIAPLLLVLVFAIALAVQALSAQRRQRQAARQTLIDYADFAAFILANGARQELERRVPYAFGPVRAWDPGSGQPLPPAAVIGRDRVEAERCAAESPAAPMYLRLDLRTGELTTAGDSLHPARASWLADTLAADVRTAGPDGAFRHLFTDRRGAGLLVYTAVRDTADRPIALYAKTSCFSISGTSVFALAMQATPALSPSLTGGLPNDSLLSVQVTGPAGDTIWQSTTQYAADIAGRAAMASMWGGARLTVHIRPELSDRLVVGGIGYGGPPLAAFLLLMIVGFAGLAIVQVRRQQELVRLRERFISNVSHELRTPLQQILVFTELLRMEKLSTEDERRHSIEVVERETRRLIELVENVLRFSRAGSGDDPLVIENVLLEPLVRETVQAFEPLARAQHAHIALDGDATLVAQADANAVRRVLINLLDNAIKYGPRGQTVRVVVAGVDDVVQLAVEDEGPGIAPADRDRVWRAFERLEAETSAAVAGSGMGLSIVRDLMTRMHGSARIEQAKSSGARFVVELPRGRIP